MYILEAEVHEETNLNGTKLDGVDTLQIGDARIAFLIIELKREVGKCGCDPTTQAGLSMKPSLLDPSVSYNRIRLGLISDPGAESGHLRKVLLSNILSRWRDPWLSVLGGVFTDRLIV
jgi:hypothetical protein